MAKKVNRKPRWHFRKPPYQVGKDGFRHQDLVADFEGGWIDAERYYPCSYDLVIMKTDNREIPGWWNGFHWEGRKLKEEEKVKFWKQGDRGEII